MVTRELLKTEIDSIQDEYLEVLYKIIKSLELSTFELNTLSHIDSERSAEAPDVKKRRFFKFVKEHSFTLPQDYTFNREDIHER